MTAKQEQERHELALIAIKQETAKTQAEIEWIKARTQLTAARVRATNQRVKFNDYMHEKRKQHNQRGDTGYKCACTGARKILEPEEIKEDSK